MGLIERTFTLLFGGGNVLKETAEVFRENAEAAGQRDAMISHAALAQFAAEFALPRRGLFDRAMDAINRIPRPALALGTLGLFVTAMVDPIWFAARMQGISLVPEPLWWLLGAIVSFYFGARHQTKSQEFQRGMAATLARTADVTRTISALGALSTGADGDDTEPAGNPALEEWKIAHGK